MTWSKDRLSPNVKTVVATGALLATVWQSACGTADNAGTGLASVTTTSSTELTPSPLPTESVIPTQPSDPPLASPTASPTGVPTLTVIPTVPPAPTEVLGISYEQPTELPVISEEEAIALARQTDGAGVELASWPREQFTAIYVLLTDLRLNSTNALGTPEARGQPVWIVTVHGLAMYPSGPAPMPGETPTPDTRVSTELNIVIDANTGEWVESYTFK